MLKIGRIELVDANAYVAAFHRHHKQVAGHRFSIAVTSDGLCCGVAICGRPVARLTDQTHVLEVLRLCTDGERNACSFLYSACARAARELGFKSIQTFILSSEEGRSLVAAGWTKGNRSRGGAGWQSRKGRRSDQPIEAKTRYFKILNS